MAGSATFIAVTSGVEKKEIAMATSGMYLANAVGMVVGIAVSSAVQLESLGDLLRARLNGTESAKVANLPIRTCSCFARSVLFQHMRIADFMHRLSRK